MKRAAVIIGIDKTDDLPKLKDAARDAQLVEQWARAQKMDSIHVLTDAEKPVDTPAIKKVIKDLVDTANVGQLVIYFAGHGVNKERHEYWLLSDAPDDPDAAVNVAAAWRSPLLVGFHTSCSFPTPAERPPNAFAPNPSGVATFFRTAKVVNHLSISFSLANSAGRHTKWRTRISRAPNSKRSTRTSSFPH